MPFPYNVRLKNLRKHDRFYEVMYGKQRKWYALEDAREVKSEGRKGWECRAVCGEKYHTFFECENPRGHGLQLYRESVMLVKEDRDLLERTKPGAESNTTRAKKV